MFDKQMYKGYKNVFTKMLHGPEGKANISAILQEENLPPQKRVAEVAKMVSAQANQVMKQNGKAPETETVIGSAIYLVSDIMDIVEKGGYFETTPEEKGKILEAGNKAVFKQGIKDKLVDPVQLQDIMEKGMPDDLKAQGLAQEGIPNEADETVAMEQYALGREDKMASDAQAKAERTPVQAMQGRQQAMQGQEATNGIG